MQYSHKVQIGSESYQIRSDQTPEYIEKIAAYVNNKIAEIGSVGGANSSTLKVAVLAAMNIAGEYFESQSKLNDCQNTFKNIENRVSVLTESLEEAIL